MGRILGTKQPLAADKFGIWGLHTSSPSVTTEVPRPWGKPGPRGSLRSTKNRNPRREAGHRHPPPPRSISRGKLQFQSAGRGGETPASPSPRGHKHSELASPHPPPQAGWGGGVTASAPPKFLSLSLSPFLFQFYPAFFLPAFPYLRRGSTIT